MAELVPVPLPLLLRRAFLEYAQEGKIFDLPKSKFYRGLPDLDTSVVCNGYRAATPLGPAAGPHDQLVQNIVLSWLGGSRIIELKTVQILDDLKIPRPCIDAANVGYNVEWSQELKLEQSLREYVGAAMFLEILKASRLLGDEFSNGITDTIFDMSVGYDLKGIQSPAVSGWIRSMQNARRIIDELCATLDGPFAAYRHLDFPERISDTITLSTFHGCPAREIEGIVTYLLTELNIHVCVKMNPTLLGREQVEHLLHDVLGYREIQINPDAFAHDLQYDEALDLIPRLKSVAQGCGRHLSVKFSNTLVVRNHKSYFSDDVMYLSGAPLHVITMNLVKKFREHMGDSVPISFSAGLDANNIANAVAMNMAPVTTCTDLLRPGGYARLSRYIENLGEKMREAGASNIEQFIRRYRNQDDPTGVLNTPILVNEATANPRYGWERNKGIPRKIGSKLWLYDCINCDKCVPVCPNDANFTYDTPVDVLPYDNFEWTPEGLRAVPGGMLKLVRAHQIANYADACNECGNCDVMCPEDGGPFVVKPRFFGSLETFRKFAHPNGFYIDYGADTNTIHGVIGGDNYKLAVNKGADRAWFANRQAELELVLTTGALVACVPNPGVDLTGCKVDMQSYHHLRLLLESVSNPRRVNFANVAGLKFPGESV